MLGRITQVIQFFWMFEAHHQQRLAWDDAKKARIARARAEAQAAAQSAALRRANPSGSLGSSSLNDADILKKSGLL
jgi:hypothetical protein